MATRVEPGSRLVSPGAVSRGRPASAEHAPRPSLRGHADPTRPTRQLGSAGRVLVVGLVAFSLWALLAAPILRRAAVTSPSGTRRSIALAVLNPVSRLSELMGLSRFAVSADRALGVGDGSVQDPGHVALPIPASVPTSASGPSSTPDFGVRIPLDLEPMPSLPVLQEPTSGDKLSVLLVGDSLGIDLGEGLARLLAAKGAFVSRVDARISTGLARPDYFDWPAQLSRDLRRFHPEVVVAMFGSNDSQSLLMGGRFVPFGTRDWRAAYARRVSQIMSMVNGTGRPLIWVGAPVMAAGYLSGSMKAINSVVLSQTLAHPGVIYVDSWSLFAGSGGRYAAYLPNAGGRPELVRTPDGIHLTEAGDDRLALAVFQAMSTLWRSG